MSENPTPAAPLPTGLALAGGQRLELDRRAASDLIRILGADGGARLTIEVRPEGAVLHLHGIGLALRADGDLDLEASRIRLRAREGIELAAGGDLEIRADGDLRSLARSQEIEADLGDVRVKANDDVRLQGERVRVNC